MPARNRPPAATGPVHPATTTSQGSHFWSSTLSNTYIEPKREFQGVGIVDFVQPFLIQSMTKPGFTALNTVKAKKFLKNGTIRTENHYKTDYKLNSITLTIIDAHSPAQLNQAETLYDLLTHGGYTLRSNQIGSLRELLRFASMQILELRPIAKSKNAARANETVSLVTGIADQIGGILTGGGASAVKGVLNTAAAASNFAGLNVSGMWTIIEPVITSVDFGNMSYDSETMVKIKLTLDYNNFKYEKSFN